MSRIPGTKYARYHGTRVRVLENDEGEYWARRGMALIRFLDMPSPIRTNGNIGSGTIQQIWVFAHLLTEHSNTIPPGRCRVRLKNVRVRLRSTEEE